MLLCHHACWLVEVNPYEAEHCRAKYGTDGWSVLMWVVLVARQYWGWLDRCWTWWWVYLAHNCFSSNVPYDRLAVIGRQIAELILPNFSLYSSLAVVVFVFCQVPGSFISIVALIDFAPLHWHLNFVLGGFCLCQSGPFHDVGLLPDRS